MSDIPKPINLVARTSMPTEAAARSLARTARNARPVSPEAIRMNARTTIAVTASTISENASRLSSAPSRTARLRPNRCGSAIGFPSGGVIE